MLDNQVNQRMSVILLHSTENQVITSNYAGRVFLMDPNALPSPMDDSLYASVSVPDLLAVFELELCTIIAVDLACVHEP